METKFYTTKELSLIDLQGTSIITYNDEANVYTVINKEGEFCYAHGDFVGLTTTGSIGSMPKDYLKPIKYFSVPIENGFIGKMFMKKLALRFNIAFYDDTVKEYLNNTELKKASEYMLKEVGLKMYDVGVDIGSDEGDYNSMIVIDTKKENASEFLAKKIKSEEEYKESVKRGLQKLYKEIVETELKKYK